MTATEPNVALTGRYPIGEAAELLGVHRNTLRRWADAGEIKCGNRRVGRMSKFFLGSELLRFWRAQL